MYFRFISLLFISLGLACCQAMAAADLPKDMLVLELSFEQPGEANTQMLDASQKATDLRSSSSSGLSGGRALDHTSASGMGGNSKSPGEGPQVSLKNGSELIAGAKSFTLQGWYRTEEGLTPGNYARLFATAQVSCLMDSNKGRGLSLTVNKGSALCTDGAFRASGEWIFFAITYDGTESADNALFYYGSQSEPVRLVARLSIPSGQVSTAQRTQSLTIGNVSAGDRPFDGLLDQFRLWVDRSSSGAVLNEAQLEQLRSSDR